MTRSADPASPSNAGEPNSDAGMFFARNNLISVAAR
jgi:hypothetical protein